MESTALLEGRRYHFQLTAVIKPPALPMAMTDKEDTMRWVIQITSSLTDSSARVLLELETGWLKNSWHVSKSDWSHRIGDEGKGTWKYFKSKTAPHIKWALTLPEIKLYQHKNELVAILDVESYPLKVGDKGFARIFIEQGLVLKNRIDTEWHVKR